MFGQRANVKKSPFYEVWRQNKHDLNTLGCTSVKTHARRRKALALAFTEQSVKATIPFVAQHVDRWNTLLHGENFTGKGWSAPQNLSQWATYLLFDMFGDIYFGSSNNTKEPGANDLKRIPHNITRYLRFYNPVSPPAFPILSLVDVWLIIACQITVSELVALAQASRPRRIGGEDNTEGNQRLLRLYGKPRKD
jgi:cytochrome P450